MNMDAIDGLNMIYKAIEGDNKDRLYQQYICLLPWMTKDSYITFDEFYKQSTRQITTAKATKEEAYRNADNILKMVCKS